MKNSVSIRFPEDVREQLEEVARRSGLTAADLVRLATIHYLQDAKEKGAISITLTDNGGQNGKKQTKK